MASEVFLSVSAVFLLSLAALSLGRLPERFFPASLNSGEQVAFRCLAGFGIFGLVLFLIGMSRLDRQIVCLTLGASLLIGTIDWIRSRHPSVDRLPIRRPEWRLADCGIQPLDLVTAAILAMLAVSSVALPEGNSDEISYHLLGPKAWLAEGRVAPILHNSHTAFPATAEMLFTAVIAIGGFRAPGLLTVVLLVLVLFQVRGFAVRLGLRQPYVSWAALLVASCPWVTDRVGVAFIDIAFAAFVLAAARILLEEEWTDQTAVAGGLFCGLACGTKYNGLMFSAALAVAALARGFQTRSFFIHGRHVRRVAGAAIIAACIAAPWYLRNFLVLGSPIYPPPPLLDRWVHVRAMPASANAQFHDYILNWRGMGNQKGLVDFLLLPFRLTFDSPSWGLWNGAVGPVLLALLPVGVVLLRRDPLARRCGLFATLALAGWFETQQEPRFIICLVALGMVGAAAGMAGSWDTLGRMGKGIILPIVGLTVLAGAQITYAAHSVRLRQVLGRPLSLAQRAGPDGAALNWLNQSPTVKKILVIDGCVKPFYFDKPYFMVRGEYGEQADPRIPDATAALIHARELGVTHLLSVQCAQRELIGQLPVGVSLQEVFASGPAKIYALP